MLLLLLESSSHVKNLINLIVFILIKFHNFLLQLLLLLNIYLLPVLDKLGNNSFRSEHPLINFSKVAY